MERKDRAGPWFWVKQIREMSFLAGRLVEERERPAVGGETFGKALAVTLGLDLHPTESPSLFLRLDSPSHGPIHVQDVVDRAGLERKLPYSDAGPRMKIHGAAILNDPARCLELSIDLFSD